MHAYLQLVRRLLLPTPSSFPSLPTHAHGITTTAMVARGACVHASAATNQPSPIGRDGPGASTLSVSLITELGYHRGPPTDGCASGGGPSVHVQAVPCASSCMCVLRGHKCSWGAPNPVPLTNAHVAASLQCMCMRVSVRVCACVCASSSAFPKKISSVKVSAVRVSLLVSYAEISTPPCWSKTLLPSP